MWELDYKEGWALKNWCFWTVVLEKTLESPLDCKEIQLVHPKGNQSWIFIKRTDVEAKTLILWPPDAKNWLLGKDPDAGKDWGQEEKGWQRMGCLDSITDLMDMNLSKLWKWWSLACCSPWGSQKVRYVLATEQQTLNPYNLGLAFILYYEYFTWDLPSPQIFKCIVQYYYLQAQCHMADF